MSSECIESFTATHLDTKDKESYCWLDITQPYEVSAGGYETENQPHDMNYNFTRLVKETYTSTTGWNDLIIRSSGL